MDASLHDEHGLAFEFADYKAANVSMNRRDREVGQVGISDVNCLLDGISQTVKAGAEDDSRNRLDGSPTFYRLYDFVNLSEGNIILHL